MHKWKFDFLAPHNGEYYYKCEHCGLMDWIARYGSEAELKQTECPNRYYDPGWNACIRNEPFLHTASKDWQEGWRDCETAPIEDRLPC